MRPKLTLRLIAACCLAAAVLFAGHREARAQMSCDTAVTNFGRYDFFGTGLEMVIYDSWTFCTDRTGTIGYLCTSTTYLLHDGMGNFDSYTTSPSCITV